MIALINPNTNAATTAAMVRIAGGAAGPDRCIEGVTATFGASLITTPAALRTAEEAVLALLPRLDGASAVIVGAFGDPALAGLRATLKVPVTGLAEAAMREAATGGRRFAVVTTTPDLRAHIASSASAYGHGSFIGTWTTAGDPVRLTEDRSALSEALFDACVRAVAAGAEAIIIGGGPLAEAARGLASQSTVPLIEPVPAAVRLTLARLAERVTT